MSVRTVKPALCGAPATKDPNHTIGWLDAAKGCAPFRVNTLKFVSCSLHEELDGPFAVPHDSRLHEVNLDSKVQAKNAGNYTLLAPAP